MIENTGQPTVRVRIGHSRTQREGWGYESTVEVTGTAEEVAEIMPRLLAQARWMGEAERDERNGRDDRD